MRVTQRSVPDPLKSAPFNGDLFNLLAHDLRVDASFERAFMGGAVDADREPADDGDACTGEQRADLPCIGEPVRCRRASPDDRDSRVIEDVGAVTLGRNPNGLANLAFTGTRRVLPYLPKLPQLPRRQSDPRPGTRSPEDLETEQVAGHGVA